MNTCGNEWCIDIPNEPGPCQKYVACNCDWPCCNGEHCKECQHQEECHDIEAEEWYDYGRRNVYTVSVTNMKTKHGFCRHMRIWSGQENYTIPWETLQEIKNCFLGTEASAIEIYPTEIEEVNTDNCRHLWSVPKGFLGGYNNGIGFGFDL